MLGYRSKRFVGPDTLILTTRSNKATKHTKMQFFLGLYAEVLQPKCADGPQEHIRFLVKKWFRPDISESNLSFSGKTHFSFLLYNEVISIDQSSCMSRRNSSCILRRNINVAKPSKPSRLRNHRNLQGCETIETIKVKYLDQALGGSGG